MSKMPNSSPDQEKFRVWYLKTTWARTGRMLIIHCSGKKKASVSLWQDFQFCFVFHEAKNANLNLYKRILKNIQIISLNLRLAIIDSPWLFESWFSRELGTSERSSRGEGLDCSVVPQSAGTQCRLNSARDLFWFIRRGFRSLFFSFPATLLFYWMWGMPWR